MGNQPTIDFGDPEVQSCPFPAYRAIREQGPVYRDPGTGYHVVIDHALLRRIATDTKRFSSSTGLIQVRAGELGRRVQAIQREHGVPLSPSLLITDPPEHGFFRALVDRAFSPARVKALEEFLVETVDAIIDGFIDRGRIEFVDDMAVMVPVNIVAALLGVSADRIDDIKRWSTASARSNDPGLTDDQKLELTRTVCELQRFMLDQANLYRATPNDSLLSVLANSDVGGRRLSDGELISMAQQIIIAGHETTTSTMASAMLRMIETPGLEARLRDEPGLLVKFLEEVLRLESPVQGLFRRTTEDVELAGQRIPEGSIIMMRWGAGNRDPAQFADPDELHLDRPGGKHLAFGFGAHFCVGNQLARAELRIAFERMLRRTKNFRLAREHASVERLSHYFMHGITAMEVNFDRVEAPQATS